MNLLRPEAKPRGVTGVDPTPVSGGGGSKNAKCMVVFVGFPEKQLCSYVGW